ncbi:hypothetical protein PybrP1_003984 [[Pythium] brassicae (nom. inval.)]|nr:hypothetical protein PybrP1_003984 [[Pythium] brassicae (nom. inval.)]
MESTVRVCLTAAALSVVFTADGAACLAGVNVACVLSGNASNIVLVIVGSATLAPALLALFVAWRDHRRSVHHAGESSRLLEAAAAQSVEDAPPPRAVMYLYISHFLSAWGDNMWQFAVPILFIEVFVDTLLPSALFGLAMYTTCIAAVPSVGRFIDKTNRWSVMKFSIVAENLVIVLSTVVLGLILFVADADGVHKPTWTPQLLGLFALTLVCGGVGQVLNEAQTLAVERDWVVVLAGNDSNVLARMNTAMRRIDLSCTILAPMAFGVIMEFADSDPTLRALTGAAVVGVWNLLSTPLEYVLTRDVYTLAPLLAVKDPTAHGSATRGGRSQYAAMWREFFRHPVFLLSASFSMLYMTVLNGSALNTAYLTWRGVPESVLGASRGAGAVSGLLGTLAFPLLRKLLGRVELVAVVSVWLFWASLAPVALAFVVAGESVASDYVLVGCTVASRAWLWTTDLAEVQAMQEWVEPHRRGAINAMQTAAYQLCYIAMQCVGIAFSDPRQFEALVLVSISSVLLSAMGFTVWELRVGRRRDEYALQTDRLAPPQ